MEKQSPEERLLKLEELIVKDKQEWGKKIEKIIQKIKNVSEISEAQILMLSYRHQIIDSITDTQFNLYKMNAFYDSQYKKKYTEYIFKQDLKLTGGEKDKFVKADLSIVKRQINVVESHVDYYRECVRTLDNLGFAIKRRMEIQTEFT